MHLRLTSFTTEKMRSCPLGAVGVTMFLVLVIGCTSEPPIIQYRVPTTMPAALRQEDQRMLAAILPQENQAWFFKIMGPVSAVDEVDDVFRRFVQDVEFEDGVPNLSSLPDGWRRGSDRAMRYASIDINTASKQLDLSISQLSRMDEWSKLVAMNVNRWRGQVGLDASEDDWGGATVLDRDVQSDDAPAIWLDVQGRPAVSTPPMMPGAAAAGMPGVSGLASTDDGVDPHAGLPRNAQEAVAKARATEPEKFRMAASPEKKDDSPKDDQADAKLKFDVPDGWRPGRMSMMRMAAFNVGPEDATAEITVITAGGDLRGNVARWMGQVAGSPPAEDAVDEMLASADKRSVGGRDAQRFLMLPRVADSNDDEADSEANPSVPQPSAIDATIVPLENGMSLFIKMTGPSVTVQDQNEAIGDFLDSLQF